MIRNSRLGRKEGHGCGCGLIGLLGKIHAPPWKNRGKPHEYSIRIVDVTDSTLDSSY
jgi:hypothetical protein